MSILQIEHRLCLKCRLRTGLHPFHDDGEPNERDKAHWETVSYAPPEQQEGTEDSAK